jgi:RNA polymerase subunit RPABC4/transcription elongation factor Spt4
VQECVTRKWLEAFPILSWPWLGYHNWLGMVIVHSEASNYRKRLEAFPIVSWPWLGCNDCWLGLVLVHSEAKNYRKRLRAFLIVYWPWLGCNNWLGLVIVHSEASNYILVVGISQLYYTADKVLSCTHPFCSMY